MIRLNRERDILRMAAELGLGSEPDPVVAVVDFCISKIGHWLDEAMPVTTIDELEALVCDRLRLQFEEIWSNDQLTAVVDKYTRMGEPIFLQLLDDFDANTFATLLRRRNVSESAADLYVAVVDCRGSKGSRRFFSRWHEIAHLLTAVRQLELLYHRSTDKPPLERLMDHVAGHIGFFSPLFIPALERCVPRQSSLSLAAVEAVRMQFCPQASFQSTLIACVRCAKTPVVYIEAGMGFKTAEKAIINSRQTSLFPQARPEPKLRALIVSSNDAARTARLRIDRNMSIPASSIIANVFNDDLGQDATANEKLEIWRHTNGTPVGFGPVKIEARRTANRVIAIMQPTATRPRRSFPVVRSA